MPCIRPIGIMTRSVKRANKMPLPAEILPGQRADAMAKRSRTIDEILDDDDDLPIKWDDSDDGWTFCGDVSLGCIPLLSF